MTEAVAGDYTDISFAVEISMAGKAEVMSKQKAGYRRPFVTERVAAGCMIERGRPGHAEWLTPERKWTKSILEAAAFSRRRLANRALRLIYMKEANRGSR